MNKYNNNDNEEDYDFLFKLVMLGDSGVGKSNIITRFVRNEFNIESKATIGVEFHSKIIYLNEKKIKLQFWDTAGQERYRSITSAYYRGSHGILVVYDITNYSTFEHITIWIDEIYKNVENDIPILLIGNKSDLDYKRVITTDEGLNLAIKYNLVFIEMSAMEGKNIEAGIEQLIKKIYEEFKKKNLNENNVNNINNFNSKKNINLIHHKSNKNFKNKNNCC